MLAAPRLLLRGLAAIYLTGVFLQGVECDLPKRVVPRPLFFFLDIAALFPDADDYILEYRAEGWVCAEGRWAELDPRPYFPMNADNKESRFQRALLLYPREKRTFRAIEAYLLKRHGSGPQEDGIGRARKIGGVRLLALREPIPELGAKLSPFTWRPLAAYPEAQRHNRFQTSGAAIAVRCGDDAVAPLPKGAPELRSSPPGLRDSALPVPAGDVVDGG